MYAVIITNKLQFSALCDFKISAIAKTRSYTFSLNSKSLNTKSRFLLQQRETKKVGDILIPKTVTPACAESN